MQTIRRNERKKVINKPISFSSEENPFCSPQSASKREYVKRIQFQKDQNTNIITDNYIKDIFRGKLNMCIVSKLESTNIYLGDIFSGIH